MGGNSGLSSRMKSIFLSVPSRISILITGVGKLKLGWVKGYGPEAIRTLVHYLFTLPGLARVYAETAAANRPARRAFAKARFVEVGQIYDPRSSGEPWVLLEIWKKRKDYSTK